MTIEYNIKARLPRNTFDKSLLYYRVKTIPAGTQGIRFNLIDSLLIDKICLVDDFEILHQNAC